MPLSQSQKEYREYFKDPRWQKLRLKILERDSFCCQMCSDGTNTLHVHHRYYESGKKPWEYNMNTLVTLCECCHELETNEIRGVCSFLEKIFREKFFSLDIAEIACAFGRCDIERHKHIFSNAIEYWFGDKKRVDYLVGEYKKTFKKGKGKNGKSST